MEFKRYKVKMTFEEPLLGSSPMGRDVYAKFIATKAAEARAATEEIENISPEQREQAGWTVFQQDARGLFLYSYVIRGFLKEACRAVTGSTPKPKPAKKKKGEEAAAAPPVDETDAVQGLSAFKTKINQWVFPTERRIYLRSADGAIIQKNGDIPVLERPLRAETAQGPRVTLARSDMIPAGCYIEFGLNVVDLGAKEITAARLKAWLEYGAWKGLGQWRSSAVYGVFRAEIHELQ